MLQSLWRKKWGEIFDGVGLAITAQWTKSAYCVCAQFPVLRLAIYENYSGHIIFSEGENYYMHYFWGRQNGRNLLYPTTKHYFENFGGINCLVTRPWLRTWFRKYDNAERMFNNISIVNKQSCQQQRGLSFNFHVSVFSFFLGSAVSLPQRD